MCCKKKIFRKFVQDKLRLIKHNAMTFPDTYKFNSVDVAKYIAGKANEKNISLNITKIQKLLYVVYGIYLRVYEERLTDEHPQAWPYGPVFPTTRNQLVKTCLQNLKISDVTENLQNDVRLNKTINFTLDHFGVFNAGQLTEWSHREGSPWYYTTKGVGFKWGNEIPDELIYNYFLQLITIKSNGDGNE